MKHQNRLCIILILFLIALALLLYAVACAVSEKRAEETAPAAQDSILREEIKAPYAGTVAEWEAIEKHAAWSAADITVHCTDGDVTFDPQG